MFPSWCTDPRRVRHSTSSAPARRSGLAAGFRSARVACWWMMGACWACASRRWTGRPCSRWARARKAKARCIPCALSPEGLVFRRDSAAFGRQCVRAIHVFLQTSALSGTSRKAAGDANGRPAGAPVQGREGMSNVLSAGERRARGCCSMVQQRAPHAQHDVGAHCHGVHDQADGGRLAPCKCGRR